MVLSVVGTGACERRTEPAAQQPPAADPLPIDFPLEVRTNDPAVNQFVREIAATCVEGDYEKFRLLWSVRETPVPRQEFERGWKALKKVRILALQKMKTREGQYLYSLHARLELDESMPEPTREVVLLIVSEGDQWRLAQAPAHLRKKVLGLIDNGNVNENSADPSTPPWDGDTAPPLQP
ncbi:MAG: hypothetical protein V2A79_15395 [Planctomycetota bacterium]